jgi:DNA modification methylase
MKNILQGNVLDRIKDIEEKSVQCVVTSPPYWGLRDYGTAKWEQGDEECDHVEKKPFGGSSTLRDMSLETTKKEVEGKSIQYKSKCKKCGAIRKDSQLGLEETPEEFIENMVKVFRGVKKVLKDDGTLWLNLGDSYVGGGRGWDSCKDNTIQKAHINAGVKYGKPTGKIKGFKPKDLVGIPWRVAIALQQDGWYLRQDIIWHKPNPMPESVKDRCTKAHEYIFLLSKSPKYYYDSDAIRDKPNYGEEIGANKRSVWSINVKAYKEAHFATFPEKLPELCIKAGSKKGDIVLDPFFGSGTTGWVAQRLGREWLGIELNPEFIKIAEKRFVQRELF